MSDVAVVELGRVVGARETVARLWKDERLAVIGTVLVVLIVLLSVIGPEFAPYDPNALGAALPLAPPSGEHLMGTDQFGRDVFSRWLFAGRKSLIVACGSVAIAFVIGGLAGLLAGYRGRATDAVISRVIDAILSIPTVVLVVAIAGVVGSQGFSVGALHVNGVGVLIIILAIAFLPSFTRIARASALSEMQEDYVSAARGLGARGPRILFGNLLPNVLPSLVIQASFTVALAIGAEATISFLGFGIRPPEASWGNLLNGSRDYLLQGKWWLLAFPAVIIVLAVFAFNMIGDGLRDILDPRQRTRTEAGVE